MSNYYCPNCQADLEEQDGFDPEDGYWTCAECGQQLYGDDLEGSWRRRFPGVIWHCDGCGATLNGQEGFDDWSSSWVCTECGEENRVNEDEIDGGFKRSRIIGGLAAFLSGTRASGEVASNEDSDDEESDSQEESAEGSCGRSEPSYEYSYDTKATNSGTSWDDEEENENEDGNYDYEDDYSEDKDDYDSDDDDNGDEIDQEESDEPKEKREPSSNSGESEEMKESASKDNAGAKWPWQAWVAIIATVALVLIVGIIGFMFLSDGSRKSHDERVAQLEQVVTELETAMAEGDYDTALMKANELYGDGYSNSEDKNWDKRREAYIELINEKLDEQELNSPDTIYVAADASSFKGKNSSNVVTQFANMGFTNVTAQQSTSSAGWFDGDMTVEHVLVGGSTDFTSGDHFNKDDPVIVYYYRK